MNIALARPSRSTITGKAVDMRHDVIEVILHREVIRIEPMHLSIWQLLQVGIARLRG
jgi:hypothetical protein